MSGGGGTTSSSSSISGSAQAWAKPYARAGASAVQSVFNQNQPGLQQLTDLTRGSLIPSMLNKFNASQQTAGQANQHWSNLLSHGPQSNPYLENIIGQMREGVGNEVNSQFAGAGRYGSGAHNQVIARALADQEAQLRYQDYGTQTARQDAAANAAQGASVADNGALMAALGLGAELPYTGSSNLANSLGALFNGGTSTSKSVTKGPSLFQTILGNAASAASTAAMACDRRLKHEIRLHNIEHDGLPIYQFRYTPEAQERFNLDGGVHTMPMAQDVAKFRPWALGPEMDGFLTIYPGRL